VYPIDFLYRSFRSCPDAVAAADGASRYSYAELVTCVDALAFSYQEASGERRPRIAILGPNSCDLLIAVLATHACLGTIVPLNYRNPPAELELQIAEAGPHILVVDASCLAMLPTTSAVVMVVGEAVDGAYTSVRTNVERNLGKTPTREQPGLSEVNGIKFTGGSTGRPKAVLQSFRCINTLVVNASVAFRFKADEKYICAAPMTHGAGTFLLPVLAAGGMVITMGSARSADLLNAMESFKATAIWVPPTLMYAMLEEQLAAPREVSSLRHFIYGGAGAALAKVEQVRRAFGDVVETSFGQTESPSVITAMTAAEFDDPRNAGSVGRACFLSEIGVMSPDGELLGPGLTGEIVARGDLLMNGYKDRPEETSRTIKDGWLHTGDVGTIDDRGYLFIKDRIRDVIISGGFNIYPSDVEAALARHPAVLECVAFGVEDGYWGERLEAAIVLKRDASVTEAELMKFAKEELGGVKAPKRIHLVEDLPRSVVGKVLRREVKNSLAIPLQ
jgi:fatty-acyl-CoA synthase